MIKPCIFYTYTPGICLNLRLDFSTYILPKLFLSRIIFLFIVFSLFIIIIFIIPKRMVIYLKVILKSEYILFILLQIIIDVFSRKYLTLPCYPYLSFFLKRWNNHSYAFGFHFIYNPLHHNIAGKVPQILIPLLPFIHMSKEAVKHRVKIGSVDKERVFHILLSSHHRQKIQLTTVCCQEIHSHIRYYLKSVKS